MKKQIITLMLMVSIITTIVPFSVSAATNGICGESLTWSLDDGTLTISGEGEMNDYNYNYMNEEHIIDTPWFDKRNQIKSVIIEEGVTQIGDFAFRGCDNLTYVTFPSGLIEIGYEAFWGCNLSDVTFPDGLIELGDGAFMCTNLSKVILPDSLKKIDNRCFHVCESLSQIYIGKSVEYIGDHSFSVTNISSITMPQSVKYIGECVFAHNELNNIYYEGTKAQWDNIEKSNVWDYAIKNGEKLVINYKENGKITDYASYNPNSINISIDGNYIKFDVQPQIINGRTLVPMRKIFEELGATVDWDDSTQTAIGTKENTIVKFTINDYTMYKNESANTLDVPAQLINGRTLIPLRAVSEAFDCQVGWDGNDSIVSIIDDSENYTMLYALNDRSKSFPSNTVDAQLTVGWYTEPVQTLYAVGKSAVFKKSEVSAQLAVGWYTEPVCTMYASDGRTITVPKKEIEEYKKVGWNTEPYSDNGFNKVAAYLKNNGFYKDEYYLVDSQNVTLSYVEKENLISIYSTEDGYYELIMLISEDGEVTYNYINTMFNMEMQGMFYADTLTDKEETLPYYSYNGSSQAETLINKQATTAIKIALIRTEQLFYENKPEFTIKDLGFLDVSNCFVPKENDSNYYPNSNVPTYTNVTGVALKDTLTDENGTIYRYAYTNNGEYNEFSDYILYLLKEGWSEVDKSNDGKMLIYWLSKNNVRVMIGYVVQVDEIWISVLN